MKRITLLAMLILPSTVNAQLVVGTGGMTITSGSVLTFDSLALQPAANMTLTDNQLIRSSANISHIGGNSISRVYTFNTPLPFTGTIGVTYLDSELAGNAESSLRIITAATNAGNTWIATSGNVVDVTVNYISNTVSTAALARISASSGSTGLPVTLVSFLAEKNTIAHSVLLRWKVVNEINMEGYGIEQSTDGQTFRTIGQVAASAQHAYHFNDDQPEAGANFYRLRLKEQNGDYKFSPVRRVAFDGSTGMAQVSPNPFLSEVTIHCDKNTLNNGSKGTVTDMNGRNVVNFQLSGRATTLDATTWKPGIYIMQLADGTSFKVEKK